MGESSGLHGFSIDGQKWLENITKIVICLLKMNKSFMGLEWVNEDRIFSFGWKIPLRESVQIKSK